MRSTTLLATTHGLPVHEAVRLLSAATSKPRTELLVGTDITSDEYSAFTSMVRRRIDHEPLQYLEGSVPFGPVDVVVDERVLVPRPETEYLFELVMQRCAALNVVVDLCTGSGNLALALKAAYPDAAVYATDLSADAADLARSNAARNALEVTVMTGDLFNPLPSRLRGSVDLIVANPPYLARRELADVPADVRREPEMALVAGPEGDEVIRRIAEAAGDWVAPCGLVAIEVSEFHAASVAEYFDGATVTVVPDLTGRDRFVLAVFPSE
ncbi:MAG: peptide chain release factor N(5)-glutamine methyltransferase [Acidimicrobiia bacterium]